MFLITFMGFFFILVTGALYSGKMPPFIFVPLSLVQIELPFPKLVDLLYLVFA